jgi:hypothetical protein
MFHRWFCKGWPGGVIGPLPFPLALFGPLLHDVHQGTRDSILPGLTIQTFSTSFFHCTLPSTIDACTSEKSKHNLVGHISKIDFSL